MKKILAIIGFILGLAMMFTSTILLDLDTTYITTVLMIFIFGLIIAYISGSYLWFE